MTAWRYQSEDEDELRGMQHLLAKQGIDAELVEEPGRLVLCVEGDAANDAERFESQLARAYTRKLEVERGRSIDKLERTGRRMLIASSVLLVMLLLIGLYVAL